MGTIIKSRRLIFIHIVGAFLLLNSCAEDFLNIKTEASIASPSNLEDYLALLDDAAGTMNSLPSVKLSLIGGEEYYIESDVWHALPLVGNRGQEKNAYKWKRDVYEGELGQDWNNGYKRILICNLVLEGTETHKSSDEDLDVWSNVRGSALFHRAWNFYLLALQFSKAYNPHTAATDLGIPLKVESDVTLTTIRQPVEDCYLQIVKDLSEAIELLPNTAIAKVRPSKVAAYSLLAKVYVEMEKYDKALEALRNTEPLGTELMDYNELDVSASYPFATDYGLDNPEVLFYCYLPTPTVMARARMHVNQELLALYETDDLRKELFYTKNTTGNVYFRGAYTGNNSTFVGLSAPENILLKAECHARLGELDLAAHSLYILREKRYDKDVVVIKDSFHSETDALKAIIEERRKELPFRGVRWGDLKRFNKDSRFSVVLQRQIDGEVFTLEPNSDTYMWRIPEDVVRLSGVEQNDG